MSQAREHQVTSLLEEARQGRREAVDELFGLVYTELHALAGNRMRRERVGNILQTTALVNEAYLRLFGKQSIPMNGREHFFRLASAAMRRILIDLSRSESAEKRGGKERPVALEEWMQGSESLALEQQIDLQNAIQALAAVDSRSAEIVNLILFAGRSTEEIAEFFRVTRRTVERDLAAARLFLQRHLSANAAHT